SGTVVARTIPEQTHRLRKGRALPLARPRGTRRTSRDAKRLTSLPSQPWLDSLGAFRVSLPALDRFPSRVWSRLLARHSRRASKETMAYGDPAGFLPLREAIAEYLGTVRSGRCDPKQIIVVTGSQQGLQLSARVLLDRDDMVWVEEPG